MYDVCTKITIVKQGFLLFYTPRNDDNASIPFTSFWPTPCLRACQHVRRRSPCRIQFLWLFGGWSPRRTMLLNFLLEGQSFGRRRSSRRGLVAALDQSACYGWGDTTQPIRSRNREKGVRVTSPRLRA